MKEARELTLLTRTEKIRYDFRNLDNAADPIYVGYEADDDSWKILQYTRATGVALYATGTTGYAAA